MLVVARNHTALNWVFDLLPRLVLDLRIQVVFAVPTTDVSPWSRGVEAALGEAGAVQVPWEQAERTPVDLVVSAALHGDLSTLQAPVLLLPHGPGHTRQTSLRSDRSLPGAGHGTTMVISHPAQAAQFEGHDDVDLVVAGDPCWDSLQASTHRRSIYRRAIGVAADQTLVVVASTWGPSSLFGAHGELIDRLVAELPSDTFRIAAVLHPNIWAAHGAWQLRTWLAGPLRAGLRLIPHFRAWRAAIVAADVVVGDHSSVSFYAACLGRPVVLAVRALDELVPGTPLERHVRATPSLDLGASLETQVRDALAAGPTPHAAELRDGLFAFQGESLAVHQRLLYRLLDLDEPTPLPSPTAEPNPRIEFTAQTAWDVRARLVGRLETRNLLVVLRRFPVGLRHEAPPAAGDTRHLAASIAHDDPRVVQSAAALVADEDDDVSLADILRGYPGARVVARRGEDGVFDGSVRSGGAWRAALADPHPRADAATIASVVYLIAMSTDWHIPASTVAVDLDGARFTIALQRQE